MIYLCAHRHQFGVVSLHKGTLEIRPLTPAGFDGPVAFMIPTNTFVPRGYQRTGPGPRWMEVARERRPAEIEVPTPLQFGMLKTLGKMDL